MTDHRTPTPEGAAAHHRWAGGDTDKPGQYEDDAAVRVRYAMEDHNQRLRKAREGGHE